MKIFGTVSKTLSLVAFVVLLAGCSSSDDGTSAASGGSSGGDTTLSGVFIDAAVQGLAYDCQPSGKSGKTDLDGKYAYLTGDTCTFAIPSTPTNIVLGSTSGNGVVTPLDFLVGNDGNRLVNILMMLQSLDDNKNLDDGIQIPDGLTGSVLADITSDGEDVWEDALDDFLWLGNAISVTVTHTQAYEHFYNALSEYFNTPLTNEALSNKQIVLRDGLLELLADGTYVQTIYENTRPCYGSWSIAQSELTLAQTDCKWPLEFGMFPSSGERTLSFNHLPVATTMLREEYRYTPTFGSLTTKYSFNRVTSVKDIDTAGSPVAPTDVLLSDATTNSVLVTWNDNSDDEASFSVVKMVGTSVFASWDYVVGSHDTTGSLVINGLTEGTLYTMNVAASNKAGSTSSTASQTVTTMLNAPSNIQDYSRPDPFAPVTLYGVSWTNNSTHKTGYSVDICSSSISKTCNATNTVKRTTIGENIILGAKGITPSWIRVKATGDNTSSVYSSWYRY